MSYTLNETLRQIDPFVNLSNGISVHNVGQWLAMLDWAESTDNLLGEYVLGVDSVGRLMIHQLDASGYMIRPPAFVEQKNPLGRQVPVAYSPQPYV